MAKQLSAAAKRKARPRPKCWPIVPTASEPRPMPVSKAQTTEPNVRARRPPAARAARAGGGALRRRHGVGEEERAHRHHPRAPPHPPAAPPPAEVEDPQADRGSGRGRGGGGETEPEEHPPDLPSPC